MRWKFFKNKKKRTEFTTPQENGGSGYVENINTCISCGREIPEGIFVCMECEQGLFRPKCVFCNTPLQNGQSVCMKCSDMFLRRKP